MASATGGKIGSDKRDRACVEALSDVSFKAQEGDRIALIGHNGAGKTTLLRVLAGIYPPQTGHLRVEGKIAPLFDIGFGMDQDATGYDNIRLRSLYLGMTREEMDSRIDDIVAFTELGPFLDMPIRTYSAGMQTRLSFAVSTSISPEVLLLDEGVGAGDAAFMEKARGRIESFIGKAGILVLASHAVSLLADHCNRAIRLDHGRIIDDGPFEEVMSRYQI